MNKLPPWLKKTIFKNKNYDAIDCLLKAHHLNTVCKSAQCPNIFECFSHRHLTFMIMGNSCTRGCLFCGVENKKPLPPDPDEIKRIVNACRTLKLKDVVITSPCRDDLRDKGAGVFSDIIKEIKESCPNAKIEVLVPDFDGKEELIKRVTDQKPDVYAHNLETVKRLQKIIRDKADYAVSLTALRYAKQQGCVTKSGIMLGFGETDKEITNTITDLKTSGCDMLTIGQYLKPSTSTLKVKKYYSPFEFNKYKIYAENIGFDEVKSGPFVRSSYRHS